MSKKGKVLVAMSGGIDSSIAALMLHEEGYEVIGITMRKMIVYLTLTTYQILYSNLNLNQQIRNTCQLTLHVLEQTGPW